VKIDFSFSTNFCMAGCGAASAFERSEGKRSFGGGICKVGSLIGSMPDFSIKISMLHGVGIRLWIKNLCIWDVGMAFVTG